MGEVESWFSSNDEKRENLEERFRPEEEKSEQITKYLIQEKINKEMLYEVYENMSSYLELNDENEEKFCHNFEIPKKKEVAILLVEDDVIIESLNLKVATISVENYEYLICEEEECEILIFNEVLREFSLEKSLGEEKNELLFSLGELLRNYYEVHHEAFFIGMENMQLKQEKKLEAEFKDLQDFINSLDNQNLKEQLEGIKFAVLTNKSPKDFEKFIHQKKIE